MAVRWLNPHVQKLRAMDIWRSCSGPERMAVRGMHGRAYMLLTMGIWRSCSAGPVQMAAQSRCTMQGILHCRRCGIFIADVVVYFGADDASKCVGTTRGHPDAHSRLD